MRTPSAFSIFLSLILCAWAAPASAQTVSVYQTTSSLSQALTPQSSVSFASTGTGSQTITLTESKTYQQVEGFGASFTDSAAWLVYNKLTTAQRAQLMQQLFDRSNGIALGFLRQPMGASDLSLNFYSYDDMPTGQTDPSLANFSIAHDEAYILPVLQQALSINPKLKIMATPWSPPGWMKSTGSLICSVNGSNSTLNSSAYQPLANYFVKFVQAYSADGVPVDYVSLQNEPLYCPSGYTGLMMQSGEQMSLLNGYVAPAFKNAGLSTKVMLWDHNWDNTSYSATELADTSTLANSAGVAWHHYAGDPSAMATIHDKAPQLSAWVTEASGGDWQSGNVLITEGTELIQSMRNWARAYVLWSMVQDQDRGPYATTSDGQHGCSNCRGIVKITWDKTGSGGASTVTPELDYYVLGHASKFVQPGAYRIDSTQNTSAGLCDVAFRNPDGSIVVYVANSSSVDLAFNVKFDNQFATTTIKAGALMTLVWTPSATPAVSLTPAATGLTVSAGTSGTVTLAVTPLSGTPTVSFGCTVVDGSGNLVSGVSCAVAPTSLTFTDSATQSATVTVTSTRTTSALRPPASADGATCASARHTRFGLASLAGLALGVLLLAPCRRRRMMIFSVLALLMLACASCGGGSGSTTSTPVTTTKTGTFYANVTATPSSGAVVAVSLQVLVK